ncbi:DUF2804 domain-containing protein [Massilia sp. PAMC28688]|uniref:DUF2804 domain-containing protein n=1 Tax=Massilia sp. PAMC28688 TaxID=2861283 RepID=UPI001C637C4D|nr:DUF2804 domain-containing protein [Massilia sp. PAMC28688]QYF92542.1 DUF2804 domain-containing protein [Massilia sp. PAMC28688]
MSLPAAPRALVDRYGVAAIGRFTGLADSFAWSALAPPFARSRWWRHFHHKRWHYVALACEDVFAAVAIVDLGWTSTAFAYAFDRRRRRMLASFSRDGLPGMGARVAANASGSSSFASARCRIRVECGALSLRCGGFDIDARWEVGAPFLLASGAVAGGSLHATQKSGGMALRGTLRAGGTVASLDGGVASIDYSSGLLARDTQWLWASAHGKGVGFNLQAGYFGDQENALWLDGHIIALDAAQFTYDAARPMEPWHIATHDGLLDLRFTPEGMRADRRNLMVAASRYVQPIGTFSGTVRASRASSAVEVRELLGVTEDHVSRW